MAINTLDRNDLVNIVKKEAGRDINSAATYKRINKHIKSGEINRVGKGKYSYIVKPSFDYEFESEIGVSIKSFLKKTFPNRLEYIVYESTVLNEFLNHLLTKPIVIVEANKKYVEDVFWELQSNGFNNVMLNPSDDERYKYSPDIIVKTMVSRAPINLKEHKLTAEKLIVDIACDRVLNQFYEGNEKYKMIKEISNKYLIRWDTLNTYAKRRNAFDELIELARSNND